MSIHYKFKSALEYDTITFDGLHISVKDLKNAILQQKRIGKNSDFDLQVTNAQTKEVYNDEDALIPKNTSLLIARVPLTVPNKGKWWEGYGGGDTGGACARLDDGGPIGKAADLSSLDASEDEKIRAMISQSTQEYDPSNYLKVRGANQVGPVPQNYKCYKCHLGGHWIKDCPLGLSADSVEIKKSTGIPKSFMRQVAGPDVAGAMITPNGSYAVHCNTVEDVAPIGGAQGGDGGGNSVPPLGPTFTTRADIPEDLLCSICDDLLVDAVMIPCCGNSFCDECVRNSLLESEEHECPDCHERDIAPTTLIPNRFLRKSVATFKNESGYVKKYREPRPAPPKKIDEQRPGPADSSTIGNSGSDKGGGRTIISEADSTESAKLAAINDVAKVELKEVAVEKEGGVEEKAPAVSAAQVPAQEKLPKDVRPITNVATTYRENRQHGRDRERNDNTNARYRVPTGSYQRGDRSPGTSQRPKYRRSPPRAGLVREERSDTPTIDEPGMGGLGPAPDPQRDYAPPPGTFMNPERPHGLHAPAPMQQQLPPPVMQLPPPMHMMHTGPPQMQLPPPGMSVPPPGPYGGMPPQLGIPGVFAPGMAPNFRHPPPGAPPLQAAYMPGPYNVPPRAIFDGSRGPPPLVQSPIGLGYNANYAARGRAVFPPRGIRVHTPPNVIDDPLEAFNRILREKDERRRRAQAQLRRSYSRSRSSSRSYSRSPRRRPTRSRSRSVRSARSPRSFTISRSRSRSRSISSFGGGGGVSRDRDNRDRDYSPSPYHYPHHHHHQPHQHQHYSSHSHNQHAHSHHHHTHHHSSPPPYSKYGGQSGAAVAVVAPVHYSGGGGGRGSMGRRGGSRYRSPPSAHGVGGRSGSPPSTTSRGYNNRSSGGGYKDNPPESRDRHYDHYSGNSSSSRDHQQQRTDRDPPNKPPTMAELASLGRYHRHDYAPPPQSASPPPQSQPRDMQRRGTSPRSPPRRMFSPGARQQQHATVLRRQQSPPPPLQQSERRARSKERERDSRGERDGKNRERERDRGGRGDVAASVGAAGFYAAPIDVLLQSGGGGGLIDGAVDYNNRFTTHQQTTQQTSHYPPPIDIIAPPGTTEQPPPPGEDPPPPQQPTLEPTGTYEQSPTFPHTQPPHQTQPTAATTLAHHTRDKLPPAGDQNRRTRYIGHSRTGSKDNYDSQRAAGGRRAVGSPAKLRKDREYSDEERRSRKADKKKKRDKREGDKKRKKDKKEGDKKDKKRGKDKIDVLVDKEVKLEEKITEAIAAPEINDLYGDLINEAILDANIVQSYGKLLPAHEPTIAPEIIKDDTISPKLENKCPTDNNTTVDVNRDMEMDVLELHSQEDVEEDKEPPPPPLHAHLLPAKSKWETETVDETNMADNIKQEDATKPPTKVSSEVLKRAENAIFAKAINAIRPPIEIKKISVDRAKLYSSSNKAGAEEDDGTTKSVNVQVTLKNDHYTPVMGAENDDLDQIPPPPPPPTIPPPPPQQQQRLSVKERLGCKVDDLDRIIRIDRKSASPPPKKTDGGGVRRRRIGGGSGEKMRYNSRDKDRMARSYRNAERRSRSGDRKKIVGAAAEEEDCRKKLVANRALKIDKKPRRTRTRSRDRKKDGKRAAAAGATRVKDKTGVVRGKKDATVRKKSPLEKKRRQRSAEPAPPGTEDSSPPLPPPPLQMVVEKQRKLTLDEAAFEPDYDDVVMEEESEGGEGEEKSKRSTTPQPIVHLHLQQKKITTSVKVVGGAAEKSVRPAKVVADESSSDSSSSAGGKKKKNRHHKKRSSNKKRKRRESSSSSTEASSNCSESEGGGDRERKRKKHRKKTKKSKKRKHKDR